MRPKLIIADDGFASFVEIDGKTLGSGTEYVRYEKTGGEPATLDIHISDVNHFKFLPSGYADKMIKTSEWKDVIKERPKATDYVLVTNGKEVRIGHVGGGGVGGFCDPRAFWSTFWYSGEDIEFSPTHWMPLPDVPSHNEIQRVNNAADAIVEKNKKNAINQ